MYTAKIITSQAEWESFIQKQSPQLFVQAWQYADFNNNYGDQTFFVGITKDNGQEIVGGSLVVTVNARRGRFYYLPYGPIIGETERAPVFLALHNFLVDKAKTDNVNFIRTSPFWKDNSDNQTIFQTIGYKPAPMHALAETTWLLPLDANPETLLKNMKQNHRNLIRRAKREGVVIKKSEKIEDLEALHNLLKITAARHNFTPFSLKYMRTEFAAFAPDHVKIYEAHYDNKILGSAVIFFYGDTVVYRHSGSLSDPKYRKIPANYAIQWQVIQDAQTAGYKFYNFWGIAPESAGKKHPFYGITHFKKGFGGHQIDLIHCQDYPVNYKYWFNWLIETFRRIKRGF